MSFIKSGGGINAPGLLGAGSGHINNGKGNIGGKGNGGGGGGTGPSNQVDLNAIVNAGLTSAVGKTLQANPSKTYYVTQPENRGYGAWIAVGTTAFQNRVKIASTEYGNLNSNYFPTPAISRMDFNSRRVTISGASSYVFWINDSPVNDNSGGLSLLLTESSLFIYPPPLDNYSTGLFSCGGNLRLLTSWTGSLYRVRRSSDNAEMDVPYTSQNLDDQTAVLTWAAGSDVFLTTVYDQSGNGNNHVQTTTTKQPRVATAGVYDDGFRFDGTDDYLICINNASANTEKSFFLDKTTRTFGGSRVSLAYNDLSGGFQLQDIDSTHIFEYMFEPSTASYSFSQPPINGDGPIGFVMRKGQSPGYAGMTTYREGITYDPVPTQAGDTAGGGSAGTFSAGKYTIGSQTAAGSSIAAMNLRKFAFYETDKRTDGIVITASMH